MNVRHGLANALYGAAVRVDRHVEIVDGGYTIGTEPSYSSSPTETTTVQIHTQPTSPVWGRFQPERSYTYAALNIGVYSNHITLFLNRETTRRLLMALREFDASFGRYGESR